MTLRPYQQAAVDSVFDYYESGQDGNPLIVAPTGSGKSHIIAALCQEVCLRYPGVPILILSHVKEILQQNAGKLYAAWPEVPLGIFSAGLNSKRIGRITLASIQSIHNKTAALYGEFNRPPGLVIVDESHLIPKKGNGRYRKFFQQLTCFNPNFRIIGLTATPYRLDSGLLHQGGDKLFTDIVYNISISELLEQGHLVPLVSKNPEAQADLSNVRKAGGEYVLHDAAAAVDKDSLTHAAIDEMLRYGANRGSWLVFCTSIEHVRHVAAALLSRGIAAEAVTGKTLPMLRDMTLRKFRSGELRAVVNCEVLTTGFDAPRLDMIAVLRPTMSTGLFVQMLGRGMRPSSETGKKDCLVLDFAGNLEKHGPIDRITIETKEKGERGEAEVTTMPGKTCPNCRTFVPLSARECLECGYQFPEPEIKHAPTASARPVMSGPPKPEPYEVSEVRYELHRKKGAPAGYPLILRVTYHCGLTARFKEWICLEHEGYARQKAERWWKTRGGSEPAPATVNEALQRTGELKTPFQIWVLEDGKFDRVVSANFRSAEEEAERLKDFDYELEHGIV